jgi:hypothetical protein
MGHVQSGRKASGPKLTQPDLLWPTWRDLVSEFKFRRLAMHLARSGSGWGFYGLDVVSTLRATPMATKALARLQSVDDALLNRLAGLAAVNARRHEAMWRFAALFYITVPVTLFLAALQGAPDFIRLYLAALGWVGALMAFGLTIQMLHYFAAQWRARQIEAVIDIARIERGIPGQDR